MSAPHRVAPRRIVPFAARRMAFVTGAIQATMGGVLWYVGSRSAVAGGVSVSQVGACVFFALAVVFLSTSIAAPAVAVDLYRRWTAGAHAIGVALTILAFSVVFVVLLPLFLFVRRSDPLGKRLGAASYWVPSPPDDPSWDRALRQY